MEIDQIDSHTIDFKKLNSLQEFLIEFFSAFARLVFEQKN